MSAEDRQATMAEVLSALYADMEKQHPDGAFAWAEAKQPFAWLRVVRTGADVDKAFRTGERPKFLTACNVHVMAIEKVQDAFRQAGVPHV